MLCAEIAAIRNFPRSSEPDALAHSSVKFALRLCPRKSLEIIALMTVLLLVAMRLLFIKNTFSTCSTQAQASLTSSTERF